MSANPRVKDGVGRFKTGAISSSGLSVSFNSIILLRYSFIMEDGCVTLKEVLEVKRTDSDLLAFVWTENKVSTWVLWVLVLFPTMVLKVL